MDMAGRVQTGISGRPIQERVLKWQFLFFEKKSLEVIWGQDKKLKLGQASIQMLGR